MKAQRRRKRRRSERPGSRYWDLKTMLDDRRRALQAEVQGKMRGVREEGSWGGKLNGSALSAVESAVSRHPGRKLEFALVQMKSETLNKVNDALWSASSRAVTATTSIVARKSRRRRLRALALRASAAGPSQEEPKETAEQRERQLTARRGTSSLFLDM